MMRYYDCLWIFNVFICLVPLSITSNPEVELTKYIYSSIALEYAFEEIALYLLNYPTVYRYIGFVHLHYRPLNL